MNIRRAVDTDISVIQKIVQITWPHTYLSIIGPNQLTYMVNLFYSKKAITEQMAAGHRFTVAEDEGFVLAFSAYNQIDETTWKLQKLYALPHQQGKGVGRLLIDFLLNDIKPYHPERLILNVNRHNTAIEFYKKLDFQIIAEEDIDIGEGYFMNDYVMEKKLVDTTN